MAPYSSNLVKQEPLYLLTLIRKIHFYRATQDLLIRDQASLESVSTSMHLFTFPRPGEVFSPRIRSVLLHSSPVMHVHWNPVRQRWSGNVVPVERRMDWRKWGRGYGEVCIPASAFNKLCITHLLELKPFFSEKFGMCCTAY